MAKQTATVAKKKQKKTKKKKWKERFKYFENDTQTIFCIAKYRKKEAKDIVGEILRNTLES